MHDEPVRLKVWTYVCGHCGALYRLPGADLSFNYGTFLAVSRHGEVTILDSFQDQILDEVLRLMSDDDRSKALSDEERRQLLMAVLSYVLDRDGHGDRFHLDGSSGCPLCGSRTIGSFASSEEDAGITDRAASHRRWDAMTAEERRQAVGEALDSEVDGAPGPH